ncbi:hypothetical protein ACFX1S_032083 [Malus domestica]
MYLFNLMAMNCAHSTVVIVSVGVMDDVHCQHPWMLNLSKVVAGDSTAQSHLLTVVFFVCWGIWKTRCQCVFEHKSPSAFTTARKANVAAWEFLASTPTPTLGPSPSPTTVTIWAPWFISYHKMVCHVHIRCL